jgi:uncharacterized membrane-anchored protein
MTGRWGRRRARVAAACALQLLLVGVAVAPSLSARVLGEQYRLAVAPVDPIDPFRGAYVTLDYPGLAEVVAEDSWETGTVYVPLERAGELWEGARAQAQPPASGPYLRCSSEGWRVRCGIESFFASQDRARELERELVDGAVAHIRVDSRGNAAVVAIEPGEAPSPR